MVASLFERVRLSPRLIIWAAALLHAAVTFSYSLTRLYTYKTSWYDLGAFTHMLWRMSQAQPPLVRVFLPYDAIHWLGFHFTPLIYGLALPFALWPQPEMLLLLQSLCMAGAAVVLYHAAIHARLTAEEACGWSLAYLCNAFVFNAALFDFHEVAIATILFAAIFWSIFAYRFGWFCLYLLLLVMTKEHYGLAVAMFGIVWARENREWPTGICVALLGLLVVPLVMLFAIPYFSGAEHPMLAHSGTHMQRFAWMGQPGGEFLRYLEQTLTSRGALDDSGFSYIAMLGAPVLFLPLLAPIYLLPAAADIGVNFLSTTSMLRSATSYHSAPIIPVLIVAAWQATKHFHHGAKLMVGAAIVLSLLTLWRWNGITFWEMDRPVLQSERQTIDEIERKIEDSRFLMVQTGLGAFFTKHPHIAPFPYRQEIADAAVLRLEMPFKDVGRLRLLNEQYDPENYIPAVRRLVDNPGWNVAYWQDPWLVLTRAPAAGSAAKKKEIRQALDRLAGAERKQ